MPERIQLRRTKGWRLPEGAFPPSHCTAWEDCRHDGVCHDPGGCAAVGPNQRDMDAEDDPE